MRTKISLMTAAAFVGGMSAAPASAQTSIAYGNGASLPAPYSRQAFDCYGVKADLITKNPTTPDAPTATTIDDFNYVSSTNPADNFDCATQTLQPTYQLFYVSTGSGDGIRGVYTHSTSFASDIDPSTPAVQLAPRQSFGISETSLGNADVGVYNNGGTIQGQTIVAPGVTPGAGQFANPNENYGALVQVPLLVTPVAISFDPVYKKVRQANGSVVEYRLNLKNPQSAIDPTSGNSIVVGGLRLDQSAYCRIFTGQITNWNDPALRTLNGQSLEDPADPAASAQFDVPLQIVGRSDSSGTTSLFTRHLAKVCGDLGITSYADSTPTLPAGLRSTAVYNTGNANTPVAGEVVGKFTTAPGNEGVAKYVDFTQEPGANAGDTVKQGRVGYNGPDYVLPAVLATGANDYNLFSAALRVNTGGGVKWRMPTGRAAGRAFEATLPPDTDASGNYNPALPGDRANPADWVQPASKLAPLADPAAIAGASDEVYPIVGTSNFLAYTCYRSNRQRQPVQDFLKKFYSVKLFTDPVSGILGTAGFAPLPSAWRGAITRTFTSTSSGLNLQIGTVGITGASTTCAGKVGA